MYEHYFQCPYCWEEVSMLLDPSVSSVYVEDCEVCCNPMEIRTTFNDSVLEGFEAVNIEQ